MIVRTCPKCNGLDVHRSHRKGLEVLLGVFLVRPLRCHTCNLRFWGSIFSTSLAPPPKRRRRPHRGDEMPDPAPPPPTE